MKQVYYILILAITTAIGCKESYVPPAVTSPASYLVVEGVINTGPDSTIINLSHTVNLSGVTTKNPQTKATLTVENDQSGSFPLTETIPGKYVSPGLNLDNTRQYRLRIKTPDNQQYLSDFVAVKITPPIDSVGYTIGADGLQLYVNAHDAKNSTRYYRWDYTETWAFHAKYDSQYVTNGIAIVPRAGSQQIYNCFAGDAATNVIIASTAHLTQDLVAQAPLTSISSTSEKIELRYSILVHQYALTSDAYNFWQNLKKNTEELGSIFDAEPSTILGNIHNVNNPAESVIGYISASTVQTKRIFISSGQLPITWRPVYPYNCSVDSGFFAKPPLSTNTESQLIPVNSGNIPLTTFSELGGGYLFTSRQCADCTIRGAVQTPSFW